MPLKVLHSIDDFDLTDKKVFIRTDFNVPVKDGKVIEHIRLKSALPTIKYALENKAKVIIGSHCGRPQKSSKKDFSLEPFGSYLSENLSCEVLFIEDIKLPVPSVLLSSLNKEKIILLENLRFCPEEEKADPSWTKLIASYVDIYINDAFSVSHRKHASIYTLPLEVKHRGQGFSLKKERQMLNYIREEAKKPSVFVFGGVKAEDKIKTLKGLIHRADKVLIGGLMAYTFLKAREPSSFFGRALIEKDSLNLALEFMDRMQTRGKEILLPVDHIVELKGQVKTVSGNTLPEGALPMDIGPKTVELFTKALTGAKTIFWNGPLGYFEKQPFDKGSKTLCQEIIKCDKAFRAVGGGDSISAVLQSGLADQFDYISTGGGAALKYLEQGNLPGIENLYS